MKKTIIIHLTDLHFGYDSILNTKCISNLISDKLLNDYCVEEYLLVIILGGDISDKANSLRFQYAQEFLDHLKTSLNSFEIKFILCPGNHDIENNDFNSFSKFNDFSRNIVGNSDYTFHDSKNCVLQEINNFSFITLNSSYERKIKFGSIDLESMNEKIKSANNPIVIITHHHFIPIFSNDKSIINNTYNFFEILKHHNNKKVINILHGHIHINTLIRINDINVIGTCALFPAVGQNNNNGFTVIDLDSNKIIRNLIVINGESFKILTHE